MVTVNLTAIHSAIVSSNLSTQQRTALLLQLNTLSARLGNAGGAGDVVRFENLTQQINALAEGLGAAAASIIKNIPDHLVDRLVVILAGVGSPEYRRLTVELLVARSRRRNASGIRVAMDAGAAVVVVAWLLDISRPQAVPLLAQIIEELGGEQVAPGTFIFPDDEEVQ